MIDEVVALDEPDEYQDALDERIPSGATKRRPVAPTRDAFLLLRANRDLGRQDGRWRLALTRFRGPPKCIQAV